REAKRVPAFESLTRPIDHPPRSARGGQRSPEPGDIHRQVVTNHVAARIRIVQGELAGSVMDVREANRARGAWASHGSRERRESLPIPSYRSRGLKAPRRTRLVRCVA